MPKFLVLRIFTVSCLFIVLLSSCVPHRELVNFREEEAEFPLDSIFFIENLPIQIIQPDDRLSIQVSAFDEEAAKPFNQNLNFLGNNQGGFKKTKVLAMLLI